MELTIPKRKFVCIDYPGIVVNPEKMLNTLRGEKNLSKVYNDPARRLELWFRPREIGTKPIYGDRLLSSNLVLKVRRRKKQSSMDVCSDSTENDQYEYDANILGIVDVTYTFLSLSDFQYLPMVRQPSGSYSSIIEQVFITKLHGSSWLSEPSPLFLPPMMFSRFDRSADYCYREPPQPRSGQENAMSTLAPNIIGVSRKRRPHFTRFIHFIDKDVPTEPHPQALSAVKKKPNVADVLANVKELFEMQPVWSRNALYAHTDPSFSLSDVCAVLPTIAYYFITGPWRTLWIRFGYDPRKQTEAKIYQTLDVRLRRHNVNDVIRVRAKRSAYEYSMPKTSLKAQSLPSVIHKTTFTMTDDNKVLSKSTSRSDLDSTFRFRPGMLPAYRQLFYQLCFVEEPQVQKLIHANDGQETECLEKDGWCLRDTVDKCRYILAQCIRTAADADDSAAGSKGRVAPLQPTEPVLEFDEQEDVDRVPSEEEDEDDSDELDDDETEDFTEDAVKMAYGVEDDEYEDPSSFQIKSELRTDQSLL